MSDPANNPPHDDAPLAVGKDEIERLLTEAESLVSEIAGSVGEQTGGLSTIEGHPSPTPDEPDALTAVEMASVQVEQIEHEVGADASSEVAEPTEPEDEAPVPKTAPADERDTDIECETLTCEQEASQSPQHEPSPTNSPASADESLQPAMSATGPEDAPAAEDSSVQSSQTPDSAGDASADGERSPVSSIAATCTTALRRVLAFLPENLVRLMVLLDRPFRGMSPSARNVVGLIGLILLLLGMTALLLTHLDGKNPYAEMQPYAG